MRKHNQKQAEHSVVVVGVVLPELSVGGLYTPEDPDKRNTCASRGVIAW